MVVWASVSNSGQQVGHCAISISVSPSEGRSTRGRAPLLAERRAHAQPATHRSVLADRRAHTTHLVGRLELDDAPALGAACVLFECVSGCGERCERESIAANQHRASHTWRLPHTHTRCATTAANSWWMQPILKRTVVAARHVGVDDVAALAELVLEILRWCLSAAERNRGEQAAPGQGEPHEALPGGVQGASRTPPQAQGAAERTQTCHDVFHARLLT